MAVVLTLNPTDTRTLKIKSQKITGLSYSRKGLGGIIE